MKAFKNLGIGNELLAALEAQGINSPTPIQEQSIELIKNKQDVIAEAQTGTGKTLAFLLPMFENMSAEENRTQGLIVTPTRELAIQITQEANKINTAKNLNILAVYGGQDITAQLHKLKNNTHLIIATPGRIIDHIKRGTIDLSQLDTLVMDEADQMLHIGFKQEVEFIIRKTPKDRQTLCFSATMNDGVNKLANKHMKEPTIIAVKKKEVTLKNIKQYLIQTTDRDKPSDLQKVIDIDKPHMAILFCRTKRRVDKLEETLQTHGYNCKKLHGGMSQAKRESVMKDFKASKVQYLIATDVAARGLDISGVTHVYNYDMPENPEIYIHRIGRTGRAGKTGATYLFVADKDKPLHKEIEAAIKMKIPVKNLTLLRRESDFLYKGDNLYNADGSLKDGKKKSSNSKNNTTNDSRSNKGKGKAKNAKATNTPRRPEKKSSLSKHKKSGGGSGKKK